MIDSIYFCEPDDTRKSWCFFVLKVKKQGDNDIIAGWEICYANPARVVRRLGDAQSDEKTTIASLCNELFYCRKKDIPTITFSRDAVPLLRSRIVCLDIRNVSLRNLKVIPLEKILQDYFYLGYADAALPLPVIVKELGIEPGSKIDPELLYDIYKKIGPLVPAGVVE